MDLLPGVLLQLLERLYDCILTDILHRTCERIPGPDLDGTEDRMITIVDLPVRFFHKAVVNLVRATLGLNRLVLLLLIRTFEHLGDLLPF